MISTQTKTRSRRSQASRFVAAIVMLAFASLTTVISPTLARDTGHCTVGPTAIALSLGLTSESLAIAGVTPTGFNAIRRAAASNPPALTAWAQSCDSLAAAEADSVALRARIREQGVGAADAYDSLAKGAALDAAASSHDGARRAALVAVLAPVSGSLSAADLAMLAAAVENSKRDVPPEYRVLSLDESRWEALAEGLRRLETGDPVARADHAALVNWAINQPAVSLARARPTALKPDLEAAFAGAMLAETGAK